MQCSSPIIVYRKDGTVTNAPCGQCRACRINYARDWKSRVAHELKAYDKSMWLQLSYDNDGLDKQNENYKHIDGKIDSVEKREVQLWKKRFAKEIYPRKVRFFGCGEYGTNSRPHYHFIVFGMSPLDPVFKKGWLFNSGTGYWTNLKSWPYGMVWVDYEDPSSSAGSYVAKYIMKKHKGKDAKDYYKDFHGNPEFVNMSQGIGRKKIEEFAEYYFWHPYYIDEKGHKCPLSRYMKDKIAQKIVELHGDVWDYDSALQHFSDLRYERDKKYGIQRKTYICASDQYEQMGKQQERNLAKCLKQRI